MRGCLKVKASLDIVEGGDDEILTAQLHSMLHSSMTDGGSESVDSWG